MAPSPDKDWTGYRRRIRIDPAPESVGVEMEDDCHHFAVRIEHDGTTIGSVTTEAKRFPWTTCPAAGAFLSQRMKGVKLPEASIVEDQRQHCTHMYDLFVLGANHASDCVNTQYEVRVDDPVDGVAQCAVVERDGEEILRWYIGGGTGAESPGGSFRDLEAWSRSLNEEHQEAARILRRGVLVSGGRKFDPPASSDASILLDVMEGACFTFQTERASEGKRVSGTLRDYSYEPEKMLEGEWDDTGTGRSDSH